MVGVGGPGASCCTVFIDGEGDGDIESGPRFCLEDAIGALVPAVLLLRVPLGSRCMCSSPGTPVLSGCLSGNSQVGGGPSGGGSANVLVKCCTSSGSGILQKTGGVVTKRCLMHTPGLAR